MTGASSGTHTQGVVDLVATSRCAAELLLQAKQDKEGHTDIDFWCGKLACPSGGAAGGSQSLQMKLGEPPQRGGGR